MSTEESFIQKVAIHSESHDIPIHLEQQYKQTLLRVALHKVKQQYREILILFYLESKTYDEIAIILDIKKT